MSLIQDIAGTKPKRPNAGLDPAKVESPPPIPVAPDNSAIQAAQDFADKMANQTPAPPPGFAELRLGAGTCDFLSENAKVEKQSTVLKDGAWHINLVVRFAAILFLCALASCAEYPGSFTIGLTHTSPTGSAYTLGVTLPLPAKKAPAPAPVAPSGKEVASVLP